MSQKIPSVSFQHLLDHDVDARDFHRFRKQYVETLLWTSTTDDDVPLDSASISATLSDDAFLALHRDCCEFLARVFASEDQAILYLRASTQDFYRLNSLVFWPDLAHDFVLSRNGHGSGFWDGDWDEWGSPGLGDALHALAQSCGERHLYGVRVDPSDEESNSYVVHVL